MRYLSVICRLVGGDLCAIQKVICRSRLVTAVAGFVKGLFMAFIVFIEADLKEICRTVKGHLRASAHLAPQLPAPAKGLLMVFTVDL